MVNGFIEVIEESDHHLYMDNPSDLVKKILKHTIGSSTSDEYYAKKLEESEP